MSAVKKRVVGLLALVLALSVLCSVSWMCYWSSVDLLYGVGDVPWVYDFAAHFGPFEWLVVGVIEGVVPAALASVRRWPFQWGWRDLVRFVVLWGPCSLCVAHSAWLGDRDVAMDLDDRITDRHAELVEQAVADGRNDQAFADQVELMALQDVLQGHEVSWRWFTLTVIAASALVSWISLTGRRSDARAGSIEQDSRSDDDAE